MGAGGTPATQAGAVEGAPSAVGIAAAGEGTAEGVEDGAEEVGRLVLQAADGQLVFADALSARMLLDEYGSWSGVPAEICAPVLELTSHSMSDEATRRRFKSLSHLPTSSSFQVAELDLTRAVSEAVLGRAHEQLARRAERRQKKADEERATELAARREREKDARRHGRSALAFELEMMSLDDVAKARRRQELMSQAALPAVEVAPEWEEQWRQQQEAAAARQQVSFATMALGFGATGPASARRPRRSLARCRVRPAAPRRTFPAFATHLTHARCIAEHVACSDECLTAHRRAATALDLANDLAWRRCARVARRRHLPLAWCRSEQRAAAAAECDRLQRRVAEHRCHRRGVRPTAPLGWLGACHTGHCPVIRWSRNRWREEKSQAEGGYTDLQFIRWAKLTGAAV